MANASTIADLATASGTLVLAIATFSSVRSANRSARVAERTLLLGLRPVLAPSRLTDPPERVGFIDRHVCTVPGGGAAVEVLDGNIYLVIPLRNVGAGLGVLDGWFVQPRGDGIAGGSHPPAENFRRLTRDLYVPAGDTGFWQGAMRDSDDPLRAGLDKAIEAGEGLLVDLLYGDHEGGQRTISRFGLTRDEDGTWQCSVSRHWRLDGADPR